MRMQLYKMELYKIFHRKIFWIGILAILAAMFLFGKNILSLFISGEAQQTQEVQHSASDHNIDPVFKRKSVWKTFQSFSSHHYYFSTCFLTKHLHICRNTYQKLVVLADSPVFICCYDNIHLNFPLLILYCQFKSGEQNHPHSLLAHNQIIAPQFG
jgi:hypothetical protein